MTTPMLLALLIGAPLALTLALFCLRDPLRFGLPVFAALIPFGERLSLAGSPFLSLGSLVGMLLGVGLLVQVLVGRRTAARLSPSVAIWLLFLAAAAASALWSINGAASISGIAVLGSLVLVYVLVAISPADRTVLRRTENGLLTGGVAVVCYGIVQLTLLGGFPNAKVIGAAPAAAATGRFGNDLLGPDIESVTLLLPFVIAASRAFNESGVANRVKYAVVAALALFGILMTGSRTGTLGFAVVLLALAWAGPRRARKGLLATFVVGLVIAGVVWAFHPGGIANRTFTSSTSSSGRVDIWKVGAAACTRYCGYGAGWGTFPDVYAATQASVPGARVLVGAQGSYQAHDLWMLIGIELGLPGLLLYTAGLGLAVVEALRAPRDLRGPPFAALAGLCVGVFFLSSMEFKFFWMVLILIAITRNLAEAEEAQTEPGSARVLGERAGSLGVSAAGA